ncbi:(Fe-S)-binding protein [Congregibacter brevis]|uniref:(Fe-S)-binding protein n=1 Tax=Congregibacter brevis TaxID=3081201 RepID=A0ABZ0IA19_9GAMM|nr:(Fe-S)-binding protein [Congregibacter sp. IMCC45268]
MTENAGVTPAQSSPKVALFITCLADLMRPSVAQASLELLRIAGCDVTVPSGQTCCGQPSYNNGDSPGATRTAQQVIERFEGFDYVILPSGSCAGMLIKHYPKLLEGPWKERAQQFATRVFELTTFLFEVCNYQPAPRTPTSSITYHDSCAGLRELHIRDQPRSLLARANVTVKELAQPDVCCGFGGTFCAKMPAISGDMADRKIEGLENSGSTTLVAGDLGCLLALEGRARRTGKELQFKHIAEVLMDDDRAASTVKAADS